MPTLVNQDIFSATSGTALAFTKTVTPVAGDVLILSYGFSSALAAIMSIVQTGVVWTVGKVSQTTQDVEVWIGVVGASPSANFTVNIGADPAGTSARFNLSEWSGISSRVVSSGAASGTLSSTVTTASLTPATGSTCVLIAVGRVGPTGASALGAPSNSFTALNTGNAIMQTAYRIITAASGSYSTTWTGSGTPSWDAVIIELQALTSGGFLFMGAGM